MLSQSRRKKAISMVSHFMVLALLMMATMASAQAEGGGQGNGNAAAPSTAVDDSLPLNDPGSVRMYRYFPRYPAAAVFGPACKENPKGHDVIEDRKSKGPGTVNHHTSGPVYVWPVVIPTATSAVPTLRDEAIQEHLLKTYGYPLSDTQFQMIHRYNQQILLEQMFDPEKLMWLGATMGSTQLQDSANACANTTRNQCASAIDFVSCSIYNFTSDESNKWNKIRNQLFLPMAVLLLLPGAVLAQLRVIVSAGMPIGGGDISPFEGITRSIVAIFLIPATYLVVNYGIDLNNSITYTIQDEYQRIFHSNMYKDALCTVVRAFPVRQAHENNNGFQKPAKQWQPKKSPSDGTPATTLEGHELANKYEDPCSNKFETPPERADEMAPFTNVGQHFISNASNAALSTAWNILCAFQLVFFCYLWMVGPVVAALWVYPSQQLRAALPSWVEGVITLSFWGFFWNVVVLLFACFKGVDETGTIITSALMFLATAAVKYAFDFAGLIKEAGSAAAGHAMGAAQQMAKGAGPGGGKGSQSGASHGGGSRTSSDGQGSGGNSALQPSTSGQDGALAASGSSDLAGSSGAFGSGGMLMSNSGGSGSFNSSSRSSVGDDSSSSGGRSGNSGISGDLTGKGATDGSSPPLTSIAGIDAGNTSATVNASDTTNINSMTMPPAYNLNNSQNSSFTNNTLGSGQGSAGGIAGSNGLGGAGGDQSINGSTLHGGGANHTSNSAYSLGGVSAGNPVHAGQSLAGNGMNHMERLNQMYSQAVRDVSIANAMSNPGDPQIAARNDMLGQMQQELFNSDGNGNGQLSVQGASAINGMAADPALNGMAASQAAVAGRGVETANQIISGLNVPAGTPVSQAAVDNASAFSNTARQFSQDVQQGLLTPGQTAQYQAQMEQYSQKAQQYMQAGPASGPFADPAPARGSVAEAQQQLQGVASQYNSTPSYHSAPPVGNTPGVTDGYGPVQAQASSQYGQPDYNTGAQQSGTQQSGVQQSGVQQSGVQQSGTPVIANADGYGTATPSSSAPGSFFQNAAPSSSGYSSQPSSPGQYSQPTAQGTSGYSNVQSSQGAPVPGGYYYSSNPVPSNPVSSDATPSQAFSQSVQSYQMQAPSPGATEYTQSPYSQPSSVEPGPVAYNQSAPTESAYNQTPSYQTQAPTPGPTPYSQSAPPSNQYYSTPYTAARAEYTSPPSSLSALPPAHSVSSHPPSIQHSVQGPGSQGPVSSGSHFAPAEAQAHTNSNAVSSDPYVAYVLPEQQAGSSYGGNQSHPQQSHQAPGPASAPNNGNVYIGGLPLPSRSYNGPAPRQSQPPTRQSNQYQPGPRPGQPSQRPPQGQAPVQRSAVQPGQAPKNAPAPQQNQPPSPYDALRQRLWSKRKKVEDDQSTPPPPFTQ